MPFEIVYPDIRALNDIFDTFTDAAGDAGIVHRIQMDPFRSARDKVNDLA